MIDPSIKVGDRVEIARYDRHGPSVYDGTPAVVLRLDPEDHNDPYKVKLDDGEGLWVHEVRRAEASAASTRSDYVTQARTALTGVRHDAADIIELAKFLAGE